MMFRSRSVDGIIAVPVGNTTELMDEITGNIPTVLIDRYFEGNLPTIHLYRQLRRWLYGD